MTNNNNVSMFCSRFAFIICLMFLMRVKSQIYIVFNSHKPLANRIIFDYFHWKSISNIYLKSWITEPTDQKNQKRNTENKKSCLLFSILNGMKTNEDVWASEMIINIFQSIRQFIDWMKCSFDGFDHGVLALSLE